MRRTDEDRERTGEVGPRMLDEKDLGAVAGAGTMVEYPVFLALVLLETAAPVLAVKPAKS